LASVAPRIPDFRSAEQQEQRFSIGAMLILCGAMAALVLITAALTHVSGGRFAPVLAGYSMLALWAGLIVCAVAQFVALFTPGRWRPDLRAGWLLVAMLLSGLTLPLFQLFKQLVLPIRGFPFDPFVARADNFLFFGHDAWEVTHALFGSVGMSRYFDTAYALWLPLMFAFPPVIVMAFSDVRLRARLLGCWLASWVLIASVGAWIFGSAGPCYYNALVGPHAGFAALTRRLAVIGAAAHDQGHGIAAIDFQQMLLRQLQAGDFVSAGGISAMPSMHVAMATLFAMAAFRFARPLGWLFSLYATSIWIGSIHLGWHYALDGILGAAMMVGLWHASGKLVPHS
jgi:PAP2 superfamily